MSKERTKPHARDTANASVHKNNQDRFNPSKRIYVRAMQGRFQRLRRHMGWFFMLLFLGTPWWSYQGRQAILLDIASQQYHFFSLTLWPQDLTLLALIFMIAAFGLFFATTFFGRVWCGYLCPQTVWTFIYIWCEEKLEGNANKRRKQDSQPLTANLIRRKALKHLAWIAIALVTALSFVGYFVPIRHLVIDFFTLSSSFASTFWILFFTLCTYANAGWMRSIVCLHMCPYARFQSAMFDRDTFIVGYEPERGEPRGPRSRKTDHRQQGLGDCIDCDLCVQVCPTGIDIRDGLQYECINCGACVDACDQTMTRMGYPTGLISYTTEHKLAGKKTDILRPKLVGYGIVILAMIGLFLYSLTTVENMGLDVLRDRNQLFKVNQDGVIENTYTLKVLNKSQQTQRYHLGVKGPVNIAWHGPQQLSVAAGGVANVPISLAVDADQLEQSIVTIRFILYSDTDPTRTPIETESRFISGL
ncbi:cytochrome c oxidase accessory protein CcoG [Thaumasiovibrio sp. DFM-14]|uniref:cytochrome c oxidase accessory protein CcoG n=1 Tax=Thaumasiovibrio sp. DFM-14 TaxID=3384792 RepID=UPI0039A3AC47